MSDLPVLLAVLTAAHLGFQATVTAVVYPALTEVPDADWAAAHREHSRRISVLVVPLYLALVAVGALTLRDGVPSTATGVALGTQAVVLLLTATLAAPTHGRLAAARPEDRPLLLRRLLAVDRARLLGTAVGALAATIAAVGR